MSDPGLSHRLRQRSRRAGLMIGLSMLLTIALCAVAFTMIYSALDGFTNDFISETDETATVEAEVAQDQEPTAQDTGGNNEQPAENQSQEQQAAQPTEPPEPDPTPTVAEEETGNADDGEFTPDYQIDAGATVNLRAGPSTATDILNGLPPATPLEYLGEDAPTDSPEDGERWMKFRTEDGLAGWVREIDVTEYQP